MLKLLLTSFLNWLPRLEFVLLWFFPLCCSSLLVIWQNLKRKRKQELDIMGLSSLQGLAVENDEMFRGISSFALVSSMAAPAAYGSIPTPRTVDIDFRQFSVLSQIPEYLHLYVLSS